MARSFLPDAEHKPLIFGHRGAPQQTGEQNTLASLESALRSGADAVEADVRRAHDGLLFLHHDHYAGQAGAGKTPAEQLSSAERAELDLPDLEKALALLRDWPGRGFVLDVKHPEAGEALLDALEPGPYTLIVSFSDRIVSAAADRGWNTALCEMSVADNLRDLADERSYLCPDLAIVDELDDKEVSRSIVGTVNDPVLAGRLADRGAWALSTDQPASLVRALRDRSAHADPNPEPGSSRRDLRAP